MGLDDDAGRDRDADEVKGAAGRDQHREEDDEHEPDEWDVQVPRLADDVRLDREVDEPDDRGRGQ
jgi:hypothetical protein